MWWMASRISFPAINDLVNGLCNRHVDINSWSSSWATLVVRFASIMYLCYQRYLPIFATSEHLQLAVREVNRSSVAIKCTDPRQTAIGQWASSSLTPKGAWFRRRPTTDTGVVTITKTVQGSSSDHWYSSRLQQFPLDNICIGIEEVVIAKKFLNIACCF